MLYWKHKNKPSSLDWVESSRASFAYNQAMFLSFNLDRLSEDCLSRRRVPQRWLNWRIDGRAQRAPGSVSRIDHTNTGWNLNVYTDILWGYLRVCPPNGVNIANPHGRYFLALFSVNLHFDLNNQLCGTVLLSFHFILLDTPRIQGY